MSGTSKKARPKQKRWKKIVFGIIRWTWIPAACVIALAAGLAIGYVYLGKQSPDDIMHLETWRHIYELIFANT